MKNIIFVCISLYMLTACNSPVEYSEYVSINNGWDKDVPVIFRYEATDTLNTKNIFIMLRNDEKYPYSNIFLITKMKTLDDKVVTDTLEYEMANPDGSWKGYGLSSNKESKLWYKEGVRFPKKGVYEFSISQAMRNIGSVEGVNTLKGIKEVGLQIESNNQK